MRAALATRRYAHGGLPRAVHNVLRSHGRPLDAPTRAFFEPRLGHDFSQVRVHTGASATESARAVRARAYTVGQDVVFRDQPSLETSAGRWLLAHELTHVAQQHEATTQVSSRLLSDPSDRAEREADATAARISTGARAQVAEQPSAIIHGSFEGTAIGAAAGALTGAGLGATFGGLIGGGVGALIGAGIGALVGGIAGAFLGSYLTTPLSDMSTFQAPLGASGWWGAKFGCYRDNCTKHHRGWDIHAPLATETRAVTFGTVTHHEDPNGWGHYIRLNSKLDPTRVYLYGHLSNREPAGSYRPGQRIGNTGASGNANPQRPHLHFEVRNNGVAEDPGKHFSEPSKMIGPHGGAATNIDKSLPPPCNPC